MKFKNVSTIPALTLNPKRCIRFLPILLLASLLLIMGIFFQGVRAEEITFSDSVDEQFTDWTSSVSVPQFDPNLGTLIEVQSVVSGHLVGDAQYENLDREAATVELTLEGDIELFNAASQFIARADPKATVAEEASAFDEFIDFDGSSGGSFPRILNSDLSEVVSFTSEEDLSNYTGSGEVDLLLMGMGRSFASGAGNLAAVFTLYTSGVVSVTYIYEPPTIDIEKHTNGEDADDPTGPEIPVGELVTWEYIVTNTGLKPLINVTVTDDDQELSVTCPKTTLDVNETMICTATGTALPLQYANVGSVVAQPTSADGTPEGDTIADTDPSHYVGIFEPGSIGDRVWLDVNQDGIQDEAELGIPNVTVRLLDAGGQEVATAVTGADGDYLFENLTPALYTVQIAAESLPSSLTPTFDADGLSTVHQSTLTLASGENNLEQDFGYAPNAIDIEKHTNGEDADTPTGPEITVGTPVLWEYMVTNTSLVTLTDVVVSDDQGVEVSCPQSVLAPGATMTCTAEGIAIEGQYVNVGSVIAQPESLPGTESDPVTDTDPSHYIGVISPTIDIEKHTNGEDADTPTGPEITVGTPVLWEYMVTNTSFVTLTDVVVSDDQGVEVSCPQTILAPGATMTCTAEGIATEGQYVNVGSVTAQPESLPGTESDPVTDTDPSHYIGVISPTIDIEKHTNGEDADTPTGPEITVGTLVLWEYMVTNTSFVTLTDVVVSDDQGVEVSCPQTILAPGATMTCTAEGIATEGQYVNVGSVTAQPESLPGTESDPVTDTDPSHYIGVISPTIDIEKHTNGEDADTPTGPEITVGTPVLWEYMVTNTSLVTLTDVVVSDDQGVEVSCPETVLAPGATMTCTAEGIATEGQYVNVGSVTAQPESLPGTESDPVTDTDPSHYIGVHADTNCPPDALPDVLFLGGTESEDERQQTIELPEGYDSFLVKRIRGGFRFDQEMGDVDESGRTTYTTSWGRRERVWACTGNCSVTQALEETLEIGEYPEGSTIRLLMIDDDSDDRVEWWSADDPEIRTETIAGNGMTVYLEYTTPVDAFWYFTTQDSVGIVDVCVQEPVSAQGTIRSVGDTSQLYLPVMSGQ